MRYISENFKTVQDELIRPQMKLYFEIDTETFNVVGAHGTALAFDTNVAPIVKPNNCENGHYYAVVGDNTPVDDPNRICAPYSAYTMPDKISVPYGITPYTAANTEAVIGNDSNAYASNFQPFYAPATLCFKGGLIPDVIRVEIFDYDTQTWSTETTINNPELKEEVLFTPSSYDNAGKFRRFYVKNTTTAGRFQLNWIKLNKGAVQTPPVSPIVFENEHISSIIIDEETDLTSQTLPQYEMTVEVLDVDEIYTPDSDYWKNQFAEGKDCFLKIGYDTGEGVEYIPFFNGKLTKTPTYSMGKITFSVAVVWRIFTNTWNLPMESLPDSELRTGDEVDSRTFADYIELSGIFDSFDVFPNAEDEDNSKCNYYGEVDSGEVRQLVANALGCYITAGINTVDLHNANYIQYGSPIDYLTRYEQIQNTLEVQNKVAQINIARYENTLSEEYADKMTASTVEIPAEDSVEITFKTKFYSIGKCTEGATHIPGLVVDGISYESIGTDGLVEVVVRFSNETSSPMTHYLWARLYKTINERFEEIETLTGNASGEAYIIDNMLITNGYTAKKANRVAKLVSDISDQYEVDLVQNFEYEVGDIVMLETRKGVFKKCVITGLQYKFPGSTGHATLRRIFDIQETPELYKHPLGLTVSFSDSSLEVIGFNSKLDGCIAAHYTDEAMGGEIVILYGATSCEFTEHGSTEDIPPNVIVTDDNGHEWKMYYLFGHTGDTPTSAATIIELPAHTEESPVNDEVGYGALALIMRIYEEQGMTPPVTWNSSFEVDD